MKQIIAEVEAMVTQLGEYRHGYVGSLDDMVHDALTAGGEMAYEFACVRNCRETRDAAILAAAHAIRLVHRLDGAHCPNDQRDDQDATEAPPRAEDGKGE